MTGFGVRKGYGGPAHALVTCFMNEESLNNLPLNPIPPHFKKQSTTKVRRGATKPAMVSQKTTGRIAYIIQ